MRWIFAFALPLLALVVAIATGHWMLAPINRKAGILRLPTRFLLSDFLSLMLQLQIILAIFVPLYAAESFGNSRWAIIITLLVCVVAMWVASVSAVSRVGIVRPIRRSVSLLVLIPLALLVLCSIPFCFYGVFILNIYIRRVLSGQVAGFGSTMEAAMPLLILPTLAAIIAVRYLAHWAASNPTPPVSRL